MSLKVAVILILLCVLVTAIFLFLAVMALSATRRARMRGDNEGRMDFSDSETVQFSKDILDPPSPPRDDLDEK